MSSNLTPRILGAKLESLTFFSANVLRSIMISESRRLITDTSFHHIKPEVFLKTIDAALDQKTITLDDARSILERISKNTDSTLS